VHAGSAAAGAAINENSRAATCLNVSPCR
jgi:hypothetical protein